MIDFSKIIEFFDYLMNSKFNEISYSLLIQMFSYNINNIEKNDPVLFHDKECLNLYVKYSYEKVQLLNILKILSWVKSSYFNCVQLLKTEESIKLILSSIKSNQNSYLILVEIFSKVTSVNEIRFIFENFKPKHTNKNEAFVDFGCLELLSDTIEKNLTSKIHISETFLSNLHKNIYSSSNSKELSFYVEYYIDFLDFSLDRSRKLLSIELSNHQEINIVLFQSEKSLKTCLMINQDIIYEVITNSPHNQLFFSYSPSFIYISNFENNNLHPINNESNNNLIKNIKIGFKNNQSIPINLTLFNYSFSNTFSNCYEEFVKKEKSKLLLNMNISSSIIINQIDSFYFSLYRLRGYKVLIILFGLLLYKTFEEKDLIFGKIIKIFINLFKRSSLIQNQFYLEKGYLELRHIFKKIPIESFSESNLDLLLEFTLLNDNLIFLMMQNFWFNYDYLIKLNKEKIDYHFSIISNVFKKNITLLISKKFFRPHYLFHLYLKFKSEILFKLLKFYLSKFPLNKSNILYSLFSYLYQDNNIEEQIIFFQLTDHLYGNLEFDRFINSIIEKYSFQPFYQAFKRALSSRIQDYCILILRFIVHSYSLLNTQSQISNLINYNINIFENNIDFIFNDEINSFEIILGQYKDILVLTLPLFDMILNYLPPKLKRMYFQLIHTNLNLSKDMCELLVQFPKWFDYLYNFFNISPLYFFQIIYFLINNNSKTFIDLVSYFYYKRIDFNLFFNELMYRKISFQKIDQEYIEYFLIIPIFFNYNSDSNIPFIIASYPNEGIKTENLRHFILSYRKYISDEIFYFISSYYLLEPVKKKNNFILDSEKIKEDPKYFVNSNLYLYLIKKLNFLNSKVQDISFERIELNYSQIHIDFLLYKNKFKNKKLYLSQQSRNYYSKLIKEQFIFGGIWSDGDVTKVHLSNIIDKFGRVMYFIPTIKYDDHHELLKNSFISFQHNNQNVNRLLSTTFKTKNQKISNSYLIKLGKILHGQILIEKNYIIFEKEISNLNIDIKSIESILMRNISFREDTVIAKKGFEIYTNSGKSFLFYFKNEENYNKTMKKIIQVCKNILIVYDEATLSKELLNIQTKWKNGDISNYEYIIKLNLLSGRSFSTHYLYPIFPWTLCTYEKDDFPDLNLSSSYRNYNFPIFAQNEALQEYSLNLFKEINFHLPHYIIHPYSVCYYLWTIEPIVSLHIDHQDNKIESKGRYFLTLSNSYSYYTQELIPQFFSLPEIFNNVNNYYPYDDIEFKLPKWANQSFDLTQKLRASLESNYTSENIHNWIDLVFGFKVQKEEYFNITDSESNLYHGLHPNILFNELHPKKEKFCFDISIEKSINLLLISSIKIISSQQLILNKEFIYILTFNSLLKFQLTEKLFFKEKYINKINEQNLISNKFLYNIYLNNLI